MEDHHFPHKQWANGKTHGKMCVFPNGFPGAISVSLFHRPSAPIDALTWTGRVSRRAGSLQRARVLYDKFALETDKTMGMGGQSQTPRYLRCLSELSSFRSC